MHRQLRIKVAAPDDDRRQRLCELLVNASERQVEFVDDTEADLTVNDPRGDRDDVGAAAA